MNTLSEILENLVDKTFGLHSLKEKEVAKALSKLQQREAELVNEVLDRLEKWTQQNKHDMGEMGEFIRTQYVHNKIKEQRERASKMGVKLDYDKIGDESL